MAKRKIDSKYLIETPKAEYRMHGAPMCIRCQHLKLDASMYGTTQHCELTGENVGSNHLCPSFLPEKRLIIEEGIT